MDPTIPTARSGSEPFEGILKGVVDQVGVDLGGRQVPVPERPLDYQDVAGAAVEVGGEGVPQGVRAEFLVDPRRLETWHSNRRKARLERNSARHSPSNRLRSFR